MSSTNRGGEREELDQYWTPQPCADAIVQRLLDDRILYPGRRVLEPHVGRGAFARALLSKAAPSHMAACDLVRQPEIAPLFHATSSHQIEAFYQQDFLSLERDSKPLMWSNCVAASYDCIVGNPPFNDAERHVRHGLTLLDEQHGVLAFILRLSFLEGIERQAKFWTEHPASYIYVLDRRPSFKVTVKPVFDDAGNPVLKKDGTQKTKTVKNDSAAYGVFVWLTGSWNLATHEPVVRFLHWDNGKGAT